MSFNITPVASGYQEIHPYKAVNIDSVKINTSLIMMKECQILSDIVRYCQILSLFIVQVWWAGTQWAVNNNLKTSSGLWRAEGWLLTSWKRIWNQAILDQEYLSQKFKWTNILNANLSDFLGNLFRFSGQFIQICSWAEKSREIGAGGGSQGKEQCE